MWRPWARPAVTSRSPTPTLSLPSFTFKDVQSLFSDDYDSDGGSASASASASASSSPRRPYSCCNSPTVLLRRPIPASSSILRTRSFAFLPTDALAPRDRIVIYFTGLGVVRPTHEACSSVLSILRCFRVRMDERDVSMDSALLGELKMMLGVGGGGGGGGKDKWSLPRVFVGGKYIGGAEEVKRLHEIGELKRMVEGLPPAEPEACETCGGYRFVVCRTCDGSHKLFRRDKIGGFRSCNSCNENGLVRCPSCHSHSHSSSSR